MGLFDMFRRSPDVHLGDLQARLGRLEGRFDGIEASWSGYRDQFTRLAARLEKRDQRAAERATAAVQGGEEPTEPDDVVKARLLRARRLGRMG